MKPKKAGEWPRLSETLNGPQSPDHCQSCGMAGELDLPGNPAGLTRWREHGNDDSPTGPVVVLCSPCADSLIEPHPRFYAQIPVNAPAPGCMTICTDCRLRRGCHCGHADLTTNGGRGLAITISRPFTAFVDGYFPVGRQIVTVYSHAPGPCAGYAPPAEETP